jgi:hypothetical protein
MMPNRLSHAPEHQANAMSAASNMANYEELL